MWMRNNYVRTLAGISLAVLLLLLLSPNHTSADGADGKSKERTAGPAKTATSPPDAKTPHFYQPPSPAGQASPPTVPQYAPARSRFPQPSPQYAIPSAVPRYSAAPYGVQAVSAARPPLPTPLPPAGVSGKGLPDGDWVNDTPLGKVKLVVAGNKVSFTVEGSVQLGMFKPSLRGEYSVASDGTIYGLIHSVDLGIPAIAAQEMDEELILLSSLSDVPFSMRAYSEPGVLAIKQVTFGMPMKVAMATNGDTGELSIYVQAMVTGQYEPAP